MTADTLEEPANALKGTANHHYFLSGFEPNSFCRHNFYEIGTCGADLHEIVHLSFRDDDFLHLTIHLAHHVLQFWARPLQGLHLFLARMTLRGGGAGMMPAPPLAALHLEA